MADSDEQASRNSLIEENYEFQSRMWRFERIAWLVLTLLLILVALGSCSQGPLSSTTTHADRLEIEYQRFERNDAATSMTIRVSGQPPLSMVEVILSRELISAYGIEGLWPTPARSRSVDGGLAVSTQTDDAGNAVFYLHLRPSDAGFIKGSIALGDSHAYLSQLVYP